MLRWPSSPHIEHFAAPRSFLGAPPFTSSTISASIANEFAEAVGDLYTSSLVALGALLFLITFTVIAAARLMLLRLGRKALSNV